MRVDMGYSLSVTQLNLNTPATLANYYIPIFASNNSSIPSFIIWMLSSTDRNCEGVRGWGCLPFDDVIWFRSTAQRLYAEYGKVIPGIVYIHIPVPEYIFLWNFRNCTGRKDDVTTSCSSVNTGLYSAMKLVGGIHSVHVGHGTWCLKLSKTKKKTNNFSCSRFTDHLNDFYGDLDGVVLSYGRKTGYGGYFDDKWIHGARVMDLTLDSATGAVKIETHIRQEDGSIADPLPLHVPDANKELFCEGMQTDVKSSRKYEEL